MSVKTADRDLSKLHPDFQDQVGAWLVDCRSRGFKISISEAYRSQERQNYLYEQGRSRGGEIVTWTLDSMHTRGLAVDIYFDKEVYGTLYPSKDHPAWREIAEIAKNYGIDWAVDLWGFDYPHFQDNSAPWTRPPDTYENDGLPVINTKKSAKLLALMADLPKMLLQETRNGAWGTYNRYNNTIRLEPWLKDEDKEYTLQHEWAHWVWWKRMSKRARGVYERAFELTDYSPTKYGEKNASENFAEVYTQLALGLIPYEGGRAQHRIALNAMQRFEELHSESIYSRFKEIWT